MRSMFRPEIPYDRSRLKEAELVTALIDVKLLTDEYQRSLVIIVRTNVAADLFVLR